MKTIKLTCLQVADALYDILNSEWFEDNADMDEEEIINEALKWIERVGVQEKLMVTVRATNKYPVKRKVSKHRSK